MTDAATVDGRGTTPATARPGPDERPEPGTALETGERTASEDDAQPAPDDDAQAGPASGGPPRGRQLLAVGLKIFLTVAVVAGIGYFIVDRWSKISETWSQLTWGSVLLSTLCALAGMAASSAAWRDSARDIGTPVTYPAAVRVFVIGQLGKYVPGSVWMYVLQTELGRRAGVPRARAFLASLIAMGIGITAALIVGVAAVPSLIDPPDSYEGGYLTALRRVLYVMIALAPVALVCTVPRVLTALVRVALKVLRRPPLTEPLTWRGVLRVLGWSMITWLCFGLHVWVLVGNRAAPFPGGYLRCVGAFAIALTVGMFSLTPGGIGVRELLLGAALAPFLASGSVTLDAAGIVFASRLVFFIAEIVGAGLAALTDRDLLRRLRPGSGAGRAPA